MLRPSFRTKGWVLLVVLALGVGLTWRVNAQSGTARQTGDQAAPPKTTHEQLSSLKELEGVSSQVLVPSSPSKYRLLDLSVFRVKRPAEERTTIFFTFIDDQGKKFDVIEAPGTTSPPPISSGETVQIRGVQGYYVSNIARSQIAWVERGAYHSLFSRELDVDRLLEISGELVSMTQLTPEALIQMQNQLDEARNEKQAERDKASRDVKQIGHFRYVPSILYEMPIAVPPPPASGEQSVSGALATVQQAVPFKIKQPHHPDLVLKEAKTGHFGVAFGPKKGQAATLVHLTYEQRPTGNAVSLEQRPIMLAEGDTIPVRMPEAGDPYRLTILDSEGIDGYAITYKYTKDSVINWYLDGLLLTVGGDLPLSELLAVVKSIR